MFFWIYILLFAATCYGCGYPGSPAHSTVTFNTDKMRVGTVATYRCDTGFDLLGPVRRLCVENGTWIPQGVPVCVHNVAAAKAPMQSSTLSKGTPQKALDGSTSRTYSTDTCTETEIEMTPWWYVNLLEPFLVQLVRVDFGKSCCSSNRPATVVVRVGNNRPDISVNPVCNRFTGNIEEGRPLFFPCTTSVSGAFVSIHLESPDPVSLSICETFVYTDQVLPVEQCPSFADEPSSSSATYNGNCFIFYNNQPRTLEGARRFCDLQGGSLVHETSPALQGFLSWELYKRHRKNPGTDYWNGAVREKGSKNWRWINNQEVTISFWSVPATSENCSRFDGSKGWLWSNTACDQELNYICQHKPISCGKPERPVNSTLLYRDTDIGSVVEYRCGAGHVLVGSDSRTCLTSGFFSDFPPKCSYLECGFPANIANGGYNLINGSRYYLSMVEYSCQDGYILVGQKDLLCDADRKWNGPPPRCDLLLCYSAPSVTNANATLSVNATFPGTSVQYACDSGYKLVGMVTIYCDATGFWNPSPPFCEVDKSKLATTRNLENKQKRNRASIAARLNMGGIIALGIFGGFVFLAVIISIVVIIVRRSTRSRDSLDSLSTYESGGSRERLYQQRQYWASHPSEIPPSSAAAAAASQHQQEPRRKVRTSHEDVREPLSGPSHHHHHHHHAHHSHQGGHRDSDTSLETSTSSAASSKWCPKHERRSGAY